MTMFDDSIKKAAVSLIDQGKATVAEVADLVGVPRQNVDYWARKSHAPRSHWSMTRAREKYLKAEWEKALKSAAKSKVAT